jgi:hypothetical protein
VSAGFVAKPTGTADPSTARRDRSAALLMTNRRLGALSAAYPTQAPTARRGRQRQGLTPISCHAVLERSACAPFIKERRMKCINATSLRRKSGQWGTPTFVAGAGGRVIAPLTCHRQVGSLGMTKGRVALISAAVTGDGQLQVIHAFHHLGWAQGP